MGKRIDFAIVWARALDDSRIAAVGEALAKAGLRTEDLAEATVLGLQAQLAIAVLRPGVNGLLPGDGVAATRRALGCSPSIARAVVRSFVSGGLLRAEGDALYLVGFREAYEPLLEKRRKDAAAKSARLAGRSARPDATVGTTLEPAGGESAPTSDTPVAGSRDPSPESTSKSPAPPLAAGLLDGAGTIPPSNGNGSRRRERRDLRLPVELLLHAKGITLSGRGGCGISTWRKNLKAATDAGAPEAEVAEAVAASSPIDKPWTVLRPFEAKYGHAGRNGRHLAPVNGTAFAGASRLIEEVP